MGSGSCPELLMKFCGSDWYCLSLRDSVASLVFQVFEVTIFERPHVCVSLFVVAAPFLFQCLLRPFLLLPGSKGFPFRLQGHARFSDTMILNGPCLYTSLRSFLGAVESVADGVDEAVHLTSVTELHCRD